jgi:hypothetical protein
MRLVVLGNAHLGSFDHSEQHARDHLPHLILRPVCTFFTRTAAVAPPGYCMGNGAAKKCPKGTFTDSFNTLSYW